MSTNLVALLGFVSAAEKYISAHAKQSGIEELVNLDINKLKKQLSDELSAFDVYDNHKLVKAGEEAFEDYINDRIKELNAKKKNVIDELGEIFDVNFNDVGIEDEDVAKETLDTLLEEYKEEDAEELEEINYFGLDEDDETLRVISNAASGNCELREEPVYVPTTGEIDEIYNEVIEHENSNLEENSEEETVEETCQEETVEDPVSEEETKETSSGLIPLSQVLREFSTYETSTSSDFYAFSLQEALDDEKPSKDESLKEETLIEEVKYEPKSELEEALLEYPEVEEETESEETEEEKMELIPDFDYHYYDPNEDKSERILVNPCYSDDLLDEETSQETNEEIQIEEEIQTEEVENNEEDKEELSLTEEIVQEVNELNEAVIEEDYDWDFYNPSIFHYIENPGLDVVFNGDDIFEVNNEIYDEDIVNKDAEEDTPKYGEVIQNPGVDSEIDYVGEEDKTDIENKYLEKEDLVIDELVQYTPIDLSQIVQNPGVDSEEILDEVQEEIYEAASIIQNPGVDSEPVEPELEESNEEEVQDEVVYKPNSFIQNPGLDDEVEKSEIQEEIEETEEDYVDSLMNDISLDKEEKIIVEDENVEIYKQISKMFPYLSYAFVKSAFDLKETLSNSYNEGEEVIVLHRANFKDVDDLRKFVEIAMMHGYEINADELKMIVDVFMKHINTDGLILNNIFEIANQVRLLNGQYEGYRVLTKDDE